MFEVLLCAISFELNLLFGCLATIFIIHSLIMNEFVDNLIVVAHPDDEILGFGGSGALLASRGECIQSIILSGDVTARQMRPSDQELHNDILTANCLLGFQPPVLGPFPNIEMNVVPHLKLVQFIESQIELFQPRRVFTHHPRDLNDDHSCVAKACLAAVRLGQRRSEVRMVESVHFMEVLSSTDWSFPGYQPPFEPNLFVGIGNLVERKIDALSCYRHVMRDFPHPRSREVLTGLAAYRGGQCGLPYAEAFQTVFQLGL